MTLGFSSYESAATRLALRKWDPFRTLAASLIIG
jgi:hypothetical protein